MFIITLVFYPIIYVMRRFEDFFMADLTKEIAPVAVTRDKNSKVTFLVLLVLTSCSHFICSACTGRR
jgi:hypothetical protein